MLNQIASETHVAIRQDTDVVVVCHKGRVLAEELGLSRDDQVMINIAVSEIAHNIIRYAEHGKMTLCPIQKDGKQGVVVIAYDEGPGISDVERALQDGYSTGEGLGLGLPGARRLMDEFEIDSQIGKGTTVTMRKWKH